MYPAAGYPGANGARPGQPERRRAWGWVALGLAALLVVGLATFTTVPLPERGVRGGGVPALVEPHPGAGPAAAGRRRPEG